jgi:two-component system chemotaxis response regulator CheB
MPGHDIVLIGASAGGVQALADLVHGLPGDLPASVFVVLHVAPYGKSTMPAILSRSGLLPAIHPEDRRPIRPGEIYVAPPDHHLVIEHGRVRISRGPQENGYRPAVDVLFRTGAQVDGPRVVGVVLTGNLDDGTAGLSVVKKHGGVAVVQDPDEAEHSGMPRSAMHSVQVDHVLPLALIPRLLEKLAREPLPEIVREPAALPTKSEVEHGIDPEGQGIPSAVTCPDCGGTLYEREEGGLMHFRCRTGHAYSPESLLAKQSESLEASLWAAVRSLEENAALSRRMDRWMHHGRKDSVRRYAQRAEEAERHAETLRKILVEGMLATEDPEPVDEPEPEKAVTTA